MNACHLQNFIPFAAQKLCFFIRVLLLYGHTSYVLALEKETPFVTLHDVVDKY